MNFIQMRYFCKAAELEHICKAAEELNITQPTLTAAIRKLEQEFSVTLFRRQGRNIVLTDAGRELYAHSKPILGQLQSLYRDMSVYESRLQRTVEILTPPNVITVDIFKRIEELDAGISLLLRQIIDRDAVQRFYQGDIDFFITAQNIEEPSVTGLVLEEDRMVLVSPGGCFLGERAVVSLHELRNCGIASYPNGDPLREHFERLCLDAGFLPKVVFEATSAAELLVAAESRKCLAYIPERMIPATPRCPMYIYGIAEETSPEKLSIYWLNNRPLGRTAKIVCDIIVNHYRKCSR